MIFGDSRFKKVYEILSKSWLTEREIREIAGDIPLDICLQVLKKGNLVEEQWRMPKPGSKPEKEFRATHSKFRANFQCNLSDLSDLIYLSLSNDETLRETVGRIEGELGKGNSSINDLSRKVGVSPIFIKGLAKRIPHMDVKGQGLVLLDTDR